jgi:hypothetical protein
MSVEGIGHMVCRGARALHVISLVLTAALDVLHLQRVSPCEPSSLGFDSASSAYLEKTLVSVVDDTLSAGHRAMRSSF